MSDRDRSTDLLPASDELRILLASARHYPSDPGSSPVPDLIGEGEVDWLNLLELAERHNLVPRLHAYLAGCPEFVPPPIRQSLDQRVRINARRVLQVAGELVGVLRLLASDGVFAVPFKGPILSLQLYGTLAFRQVGDLDLLVRAEDYPRARQLLIDAGFEPATHGGRRLPTGMSRRSSDVLSRGKQLSVELFWRFTNRDIGFRFDMDTVEQNLTTIEVSGTPVPTFAHSDLLLLLAVNGARHGWSRIELVTGYGEAIRAVSEAEQIRAVERAEDARIRRMLLLGMSLASNYLGAPSAAAIRYAAEDDPWVSHLARAVVARWEREAIGHYQSDLLLDVFHFHLRERASDQLRFLLLRSIAPTLPRSLEIRDAGQGTVARLGGAVFDAIWRLTAIARSYSEPEQMLESHDRPTDGRAESEAVASLAADAVNERQ